MLSPLLALALLAGCPPKRDPVLVDRERLMQLEVSPAPQMWLPHATLSVSEPVLEQVFGTMMEDLLQNGVGVSVRAPFGADFVLTPEVADLDVDLASGRRCPTCIDVGADWTGSLGVHIGSPTGHALDYDLPWTARTQATVNVFTAPDERGVRILQLRKARATPVELDVDFGGIPEPYNTLATAWLENKLVETTINDALTSPVELLELPDRGPMQVRDVRVRAHEGLVVEMLFTTLEGSPAPALFSDDGWVAAIPATSLIGLARAAQLRDLSDDEWFVEPWTLSLYGGDRFSFGMRVWKAGRHATWRDYEVLGQVRLDDDGDLVFEPDLATETDKSGWAGKVIGPVVKKRVLDSLRDGADMTVPGRTMQELGGARLRVRTTSVEARHDVLVLRGEVVVTGADPG